MPSGSFILLLCIVVLLSKSVTGQERQNILFECDFEDTCLFTNDGSLQWQITSGPTPSRDTGPDGDHTTGEGNYLYVEASDAEKEDKAVAFFSSVSTSESPCSTIRFFYNMNGADVGVLNMYLLGTTPYYYTTPVWSKSGNQGAEWREAIIETRISVNFRIAFEVTMIGAVLDRKGDIAIDDITIEQSECNLLPCEDSQVFCLNGGTCITESVDGQTEYKCLCTGGWSGIHCENDKDECADDPCNSQGVCTHGLDEYNCVCDPGYYGDDCQLIDMCVDGQVNRCQNGGICNRDGNNFNCTCQPGYTGHICDVNIDDCALTPCQNNGVCIDGVDSFTCECKDEWEGSKCQYQKGSCDFEEGMLACGYFFENLDWRLREGRTPVPSNGPKQDHTTGEGYYVYGTVDNFEPGAKATLVSPNLPDSSVGKCTIVRFWYYMEGNSIGTLNFYVRTSDTSHEIEPAWNRTGSQGAEWLEAVVEISSPVSYSLVFDALSKYDNTFVSESYIAVDDVTIEPGSCEYRHCSPNPCKNGGTCIEEGSFYKCVCTETWTGPDCTEDRDMCELSPCQHEGQCMDVYQGYRCSCTPEYVGYSCEYITGSCTFDNPYDPECSYENMDGNFNWIIMSGPTDTSLTGPSVDHTMGTELGFYIYSEASDTVGGDKARIRTPTVPGSANKCTGFDFWYHMNGNNIGELAVYVEYNEEMVTTPVWKKTGEVGNEWMKAELNISSPHDFRIVFEAVMLPLSILEQENRGDIALDDIIFHFDRDCTYEMCFQQPCMNGGTCVTLDDSEYECLCTPGYGGKNCEELAACSPDKCENGGNCVIGTDGEADCLCANGWVGESCELTDYCYPSMCQNGGTCITTATTYECECPEGYTGDLCEENVDDCKPNPCLNGGSCIDLVNAFECNCAGDYLGKYCEKIQGSCDFEYDTCQWYTDQGLDWKRYSGNAPDWPFSGPRNDHTYGNDTGFYIFTEVFDDLPDSNSKYRIRSPTYSSEAIGPGKIFTLEFYYHMLGQNIGKLNIYLHDGSNTIPVASITQADIEDTSEWQKFSQQINPTSSWSISFEHEVEKSIFYFADMAIDDISFLISDDFSIGTPKITSTARSNSGVLTSSNLCNEDCSYHGNDALSGGAIAGIVIGILACIGLIFGGVYYYYNQNQIKSKTAGYGKNMAGMDNQTYEGDD